MSDKTSVQIRLILLLIISVVYFATDAFGYDTTNPYTSTSGTDIINNTTSTSNITSSSTNTNTNNNTDNITSNSTITGTNTNTNTNTNNNTNNTTYTGSIATTNVSTNTNTNSNTNTNTNSNTSISTNNNTNTNSSSTEYSGTSSTNNTNKNTSNSTSNNTNSNSNNSDSKITYEGMPVNSAVAPSIIINQNDLCVRGISAAGQTHLFGVSVGATLKDENCERIKLARELRVSGMKVASVALLCDDARVFKSMLMSGTPCPFKGLIGKEAKKMWNKYPELRPDYDDYLDEMELLIDAGKLNEDGSVVKFVPKIHQENEMYGVSWFEVFVVDIKGIIIWIIEKVRLV